MLQNFIAERCRISSEYRVTKASFYQAYSICEREQGREPVHINEVGRQMKALDFIGEARKKDVRFWTGIGLVTTNRDAIKVTQPEQVVSPSIKAVSPPVFQNSSANSTSELSLKTLEEARNDKLREELCGGWFSYQL